MTVTYGFYDSVSGDRVYSASDFNKMMRGIITDGVLADYGNALYVVEDTSMDITVQTGKCWFDDTWTENDADLTLTVTTAHATLDRKDAVVVEIDKTTGVRVNSIKIIDGTAAASPVLPTLATGPTIFQYMLAEIFVGAAVTSITDANITNRVGQAGYVQYVDFMTNTPVYENLGLSTSANLIKNYPTFERSSTVPEWFIAYGSSTFTEVDASAEGLSEAAPYNRVFKTVAGAAGVGWQQTLNPNDVAERSLTANVSYVSFGVWVYSDSGTVTIRLRDSGGTNLGLASTSLNDTWVYLKIENVQLLANSLLVQLYNDTNGSVTYSGGMMLNVGPYVQPFRQRGLVYRWSDATVYTFADPGGSAAAWQTVDLTSFCGTGAVLADLSFKYRNITTAGGFFRTRPYGFTVTASNDVLIVRDTGTEYMMARKQQLLDDENRFEFYSSSASTDIEALIIYLNGWYEWE